MIDQSKLDTIYIPHIRNQISNGSLVLFTGAGFSLDAVSTSGDRLPSAGELCRYLWALCYPNDEYENDTLLQDIYEEALSSHRHRLKDLLLKLFSVDAKACPEWYRKLLSAPWLRAYTLNIDNLMEVVGEKAQVWRDIQSISAMSDSITKLSDSNLDVIHLNGFLDNIPDKITFSRSQYAERIGSDGFYQTLGSDLIARPIIFIGSSLDEGPLWEHLIARGKKGERDANELRPRSYLVIPHLNKSKLAILAKYNIVWLPFTGEQFTDLILMPLKDRFPDGQKALKYKCVVGSGKTKSIQLLSDISKIKPGSTSYLMGQEPTWSDVRKGVVAERDSFNELYEKVSKVRASTTLSEFIVLTGTAGTGKSSALMWLGLKLLSDGLTVGWLDASERLSKREFDNSLDNFTELDALLINDADIYGAQLSSMIRAAIDSKPRLLLIAESRSSKVDSLIKQYVLKDIREIEYTMPFLCDSDIDRIINVLDQNNRLGHLKGMTDFQRINAFRNSSGRQLLVAMYEATSGNKFADRAADELDGMTNESRLVYALVSAASAYRYDLTRDEIIIACGESTNDTLNHIDVLIRRKLISTKSANGEFLRARHRVIADMIYTHLVKNGQFERVLRGLLTIGVAKVNASSDRNSRPSRLLKTFINHNFVKRAVDPQAARNIYGEFESALSWDSHFWLHRGALELESNELDLAENFLSQALSLRPEDIFIQTEWSYLLFKKAISNPIAAASKEYVKEAMRYLESIIIKRQEQSGHPYHILGQQGLFWAKTEALTADQKREYLSYLEKQIATAMKLHPRDEHLTKLHRNIQEETLSLAVK